MQQPQRAFEGGQQIAPVVIQSRTFDEAELLQLDVPVAEFVPEEMPDALGRFVITVLLDGAVHLRARIHSAG